MIKRRSVVGLAMVLVSLIHGVGCQPSQPDVFPAKPKTNVQVDDHHHSDGPHGGTLADWGGGKYHVEFTVDHGRKEATVYVLGEDGKTTLLIPADQLLLSIKQPAFQVELKAMPTDSDGQGKSSRYVGTHDSLGLVQEFAGTISGQVDGTPYAGNFAEVDHAGHDHK